MIARALGPIAALLALATALVVACGGPPEDARVGILAPDFDKFAPVGLLLDHRCGSLDCHGQRTRNLQIFGCEGLRLGDASPGCRISSGTDTTIEELQATYRSLVALEPVVMTTVVSGHGANPELLTFVRKARGTEAHKGGTLITPGDDQDQCITLWLANADADAGAEACARALALPVTAR